MNGWLSPQGECYYVDPSGIHAEWAFVYLRDVLHQDIPDEEFESSSNDAKLEKLGWVKITYSPASEKLYFITYLPSWKSLPLKQRQWLYDAATNELGIPHVSPGSNIDTNLPITITNKVREHPLQLVHSTKDITLSPDELLEESKLMDILETGRLMFL